MMLKFQCKIAKNGIRHVCVYRMKTEYCVFSSKKLRKFISRKNDVIITSLFIVNASNIFPLRA